MGYPFETGPQIYMTPKAAEQAIGVGLIAVAPNVPDLALIGEYVNEHMASPEYRLPANVTELNIVMRWSGRGAKLRWQWDARFEHEPPDTPYLHTWAVSQPRLDRLQMDGPGEKDARKGDLDPYKTIEVSIADWEDPEFDLKFAEGIMFRGAGRSKKGAGSNLWRDVFEAFDPESLSRWRVARQAAAAATGAAVEKQVDNTFTTIQPVRRLWKPKPATGGGGGGWFPIPALT
jgi:hypothetical protein